MNNFLNGMIIGLGIAIAILITAATKGAGREPSPPPVVTVQETEPVQQEAAQEPTECGVCMEKEWPILRPKVTRIPAIRNVERW